MDYTCERQTLCTRRLLWEGCAEQSVEQEVSLPEGGEEAAKVLKCQMFPQVVQNSVSGERIECTGTILLRVLYVGKESGKLCCREETAPFTASIPVKGLGNEGMAGGENLVCAVKPRLEFVSCTLTGPRRFSVRGSFSLCVRLLQKECRSATAALCGDDVQQRRLSVPGSELQCLCLESFPLRETLELGGGKPPIAYILRSRAQCLCEETRVVSDSLLLRGRVLLEVLYTPANESPLPEKMEFSIPFSQMVEAPGAREDGMCQVELSVMEPELLPRSDNLGEATRLEAKLQLNALVTVEKRVDIPLVEDAYSTRYATAPEYETLMLPRPMGARVDSFSQTTSVESGSELLTGVIDLWNEIASVSAQVVSGQLVYTGKLNVCLLAVNREGVPFYREKVMDFSAAFPMDAEGEVEAAPCLSMMKLQYRIVSASSVEVRADVQVSTRLLGKTACRVLQGLHRSGEEPLRKDTPLILYFAQSGEPLWNIAKRYSSSVKAICEENELVGETASGGMLLIPGG